MTRILISLLIVAVLSGCTDEPASTPTEKTQVQLTLGTELDALEPTRATNVTSFTLIDHLQEGLLRYGPDDGLIPGLAESWSHEGLNYTFHLRENIFWNNGTPITAQDFVFAWRRMVDPEVASLYAFILEPIKNAKEITAGELPTEQLGISAEGNKILHVELARPTPYFLELTAFTVFTPVNEAFFEQHGSRYFNNAVTSLSSGPYKLKEFVQGARLILEKNESYWRANDIRIDELRFEHFTSDPTARLNLFRANQMHFTRLNFETVKQAAELNLKIHFHPTGEHAMLVFNTRPERPTGNRNLRLAFQAALDRAEFVNNIVAVPGNKPSISLFPSWLDGERKKFQKEFPPTFLSQPDLDRAALYMNEVPAEQRKLTFLTFDGPTSRKRAEYFQEYFGRTLGLDIVIEQQSVKQFYQKLNSGNFDFASWGWLPDYNDILTYADLFASWNGNNVGAYNNPQFDNQVRIIQSSTNRRERFEAARELQRMIFEDVVIIPLYESSSAYVVSNRLKGMKRRMFGPDPDYTYAYIR